PATSATTTAAPRPPWTAGRAPATAPGWTAALTPVTSPARWSGWPSWRPLHRTPERWWCGHEQAHQGRDSRGDLRHGHRAGSRRRPAPDDAAVLAPRPDQVPAPAAASGHQHQPAELGRRLPGRRRRLEADAPRFPGPPGGAMTSAADRRQATTARLIAIQENLARQLEIAKSLMTADQLREFV